mgnify:FL=1
MIDPLHNIGPDEIKIQELINRTQGAENRAQEIILALNPNMEGESTCMYISRQLKTKNYKLKISRLAHGLPTGADIQYADETTLTHALNDRREY